MTQIGRGRDSEIPPTLLVGPGDLISDLPHKHRPVPTATGKGFAIRTKHNAQDPARMPGEYRLLLTRLGIPQPHRVVITPTGKGLSIWAKRYAPDPTRMPGEHRFLFARNSIPQPHRAVVTPAGERHCHPG